MTHQTSRTISHVGPSGIVANEAHKQAQAIALYEELDDLQAHREREGRGHTPEAQYVRQYCRTNRRRIQAELRRMEMPTRRPGNEWRWIGDPGIPFDGRAENGPVDDITDLHNTQADALAVA